MASNSKRIKLSSHNEDRISELPDALVCHILSCMSTREALKTSVLSHRWKNVWASVPILDLEDEPKPEYSWDHKVQLTPLQIRFGPDWFAKFVNRVVMFRSSGDIRRFCLVTERGLNVDGSVICAWLSTAIMRNVVELDFRVVTPRNPHFEIPIGLFGCKTLMSLRLRLRKNMSAGTPGSNCFPCLKFLHVTFNSPDSDTVDKLFPSFPVLEELIIDGDLDEIKINISTPKLKRLRMQMRFIVLTIPVRAGANICSVDAPNLEEVDMDYDFAVSYSLKNAKYLRKAKISFGVWYLSDRDNFPGLADRICQLFADISYVKCLTVSSQVFAALDIRYHSFLLTFCNLNHLELQLKTCCCLQSLTTLLKISPSLEHLKIIPLMTEDQDFVVYKCDCPRFGSRHHGLEDGWDALESVPDCLISHLKTICLCDLKGCPKEVEVVKYLVKHGKALNKVTIYSHLRAYKEREMQSLWEFSRVRRGSNTCEIEFRTIIDAPFF